MDLLRQTIRLMLLEGPKENIINQGWPESFADTLIAEVGENFSAWVARQLKDRSPWKDLLEDIKQLKKTIKILGKKLKKQEISKEEHDERIDVAKSALETSYINLRRGLGTILGNLENIMRWVKEKNINLKKYDLDSAEEEARLYVAKEDMEIVKEFPNGWFWVDLEVDYCDIEAKEMGHCGRADDGVLWSLRDPNNKPHVTAEVEDGHKIVQMKGKQNTSPDKRYHDYIVALLADPEVGIEYYAVENRHGSDLTFDELTREQIKKIENGNPNLSVEDPGPKEEDWEELMDEAKSQYNWEHVSSVYDIQNDGEGLFASFWGSMTINVETSINRYKGGVNSDLRRHLSNSGYSFEDVSIDNDYVNLIIGSYDYMPNPDGYEDFLRELDRDYERDAEEIVNLVYKWLIDNGYAQASEAYNAITDNQFRNFDVTVKRGNVSISTSDVGQIGANRLIDDKAAVQMLNIRSADIMNSILKLAISQMGAAGQLVLPGIDKPLPKEMSANGFMIDFGVGQQNTYNFDISADLETGPQVTFAAYLDQNWENIQEYVAKLAQNIFSQKESKLSLHRVFSSKKEIIYNKKRSIREVLL